MPYSMGDAIGYIKLNIQDFENKYNKIHSNTENLDKMAYNMGSVFDKAGELVVSAFARIANASAVALKSVVSVGSSFQASMSQVAATMGMSADEIANNSEQYKKLSEAAKEMGATTKFSATQAAEALNYLALAGYSVDESISTLPKILNVAAAGGMDLASASDMVTDAMSALGLSLDEAGSFVDKLAKTAQKSNTSVSQLGEAILQIGGTAKSLAGGVNELDTALGILANNGIKAAEGGTALRQIILNLTAPTDKAREAMEKFGFSAYDTATGAMKPLNQTFAELNDVLSQFNTQQERDNFLATIFDSRQLKSARALLAGYGEAWDELYENIENADGAASKMAETMQENLSGAITIAKSALEGVQVTAFESLEKGLTNSVKAATASFDSLNKTLQTPEMQKALKKIGDMLGEIFAKFVDFIANEAIPKMLEWFSQLDIVLVDFKSLLSGLAVALPIVAAGILLCNKSVQLYVAQTLAAKLATAAFTAELLLNPFTTVAVALGVLVAQVVKYVQNAKRIEETAEKQAAAMSSATDAANKNAEALGEYKKRVDEITNSSNDEINELRRAVNALGEYANKTNLTAEELATAQSLIEKLNEIYPENTAYIRDGQVVAYDELAKSVENYTNKLYAARKLEANQEKYFAAKEIVEESEQLLKESDAAIAEARMNLEKWANIATKYFTNTLDKTALEQLKYEASAAGETVVDYLAIQATAANKAVENAEQAKRQTEKTINEARIDMENAEQDMLGLRLAAGEKVEGIYRDQVDAAIGIMKQESEERTRMAREENADEIQAQEELAAEKIKATKKMWKDIEKLDKDWQLRKIDSEEEYQRRRKELLETAIDEDNTDWVKEYNKSLVYYERAEAEKTRLAKQAEEDRIKVAENAAAERQKISENDFDKWQNSYNNLVDEATSAYNQIKSNQENVIRSLTGNIKLYDTESKKVWDKQARAYKTEDSIKANAKAMKEQADAVDDYIEALSKLEGKVPDSLMAEVYAMDREKGAEFVQDLNKMSESELQSYIENYERIYDATKEFSEKIYANQLESFKKEYANKFEDIFNEVPDNLKLVGQDSIDGFIEGVEAKTENATGALAELMNNVLDKTKEVLDIHSPSGKYEEVGENSILGLIKGFKNKWENVVESFKTLGENSGNKFVEGFKSVWETFANSFKNEVSSIDFPVDVSTWFAKPNMNNFVYQNPNQNNLPQYQQNNMPYQAINYSEKSLTKQDVIEAIKQAVPDGDVILQVDGRQLAIITRKELNAMAGESGNLDIKV